MIYDDYIDYHNKYTEQYGNMTLVLMEVGSFFEIYAIDNEQERAGPSIYPVCDLLNLQVSRKNKSILENSRSNPLMAGFPSHSLSKHIQCLLSNQYTVVLVRQVTAPPNPIREVTDILSPSMQLQPNNLEGNYLLVAYWDAFMDVSSKETLLSMGLSGVDVSTGATFAYEVASNASDPNLSMDEMVRLYQAYQPKELVLIGSDRVQAADRARIEASLGVKYDTNKSVHRIWDWVKDKEYAKVTYQNLVLRKAYPAVGMLEPIDALHLERLDNARIAFVYMIQFGYEHSESIISHLRFPQILQMHNTCTLEYNSAVQLNVISSNGSSSEKPLLSWLNRCATAFGARRFRERILQPINEVDELNRRYDSVEAYIRDGTYKHIHKELKNVMDLERMVRRMRVGTFSPVEWVNLDASMQAISRALNKCAGMDDTLGMVQSCINAYTELLSLDDCARYMLNDIRGTVFKSGLYADIDDVVKAHENASSDLARLCDILEKLIGNDVSCRIEHNEREGYSIVTTKRRFQAIVAALNSENTKHLQCGGDTSLDVAMFSAKPISATSSTVRIRHPWIDSQSDILVKSTAELQRLVTVRYKAFVAEYAERHAAVLNSVVECVSDIDICVTNAKNAVEFRYARPMLSSPEGNTGSRVQMRSMRHPIIERILEKEMYVPNDICLGENGSDDMCGLLLFGINASGKSSLMKAIGLNVLMAQTGMFVCAESMELVPYNHIFTRIAGNDNIFKGWSTFTVEMLELKNILHRCDKHSLVLGDELCAGTESVSALAIVAAGIEKLCANKSSFIFATHLHDLSMLHRVKALPQVRMQHLHIDIDTNGKIYYDRKLREGSGSALYGLEVCKGLGLPMDFLKIAHEVRCELQGESCEFQGSNKSRYNASVFIDRCGVCGAPASETHHIVPQKNADHTGFIDNYYHKNRGFNLVGLCHTCHHKVHHGELEIDGYKHTSSGIELCYTPTNEKCYTSFLT